MKIAAPIVDSTPRANTPASDTAILAKRGPSHAVVIGSGFGGLAAAVRLLARGFRVSLVEALDTLGGRARTFVEEGYRFDAGPTVITAPFLLEELWSLLGESMQDYIDLREVTPFYRIRFNDGGWFDYTGDPLKMRQEVMRISPNDVSGYEQFVARSQAIFDVGFTQLAHKPFNHLTDMLKILPAMMRLGSFRTVWQMASSFVKDERLRQVLSFHPLLVGGNPFDTTSIYTLILFLERRFGVHFPMGGTGALIKGLADLLQRHGATIRTRAPVKQIEVDMGRVQAVTLDDGERIDCDLVVANSDAAWTLKNLIAPQHRRRWTDKRLAKQKYSMGLFVWYFGTRRTYPDVAHHSIILGPRYKGLLDDIFDQQVLADDFSLYLHRPTATDPSLAPTGCDAFYVLSPVPNLQAKVDWHGVAETYRKRLEEHLEATCLPNLKNEITVSKLLHPQMFSADLRSLYGAAFSMAPTLRQSAYFRPHNKSEDVEGLFFVGAGTHPGAGVPGVLSSARVLDSIVPLAEA